MTKKFEIIIYKNIIFKIPLSIINLPTPINIKLYMKFLINIRKTFQCSGEIDAVERGSVAKKVGARASRQLGTSGLNYKVTKHRLKFTNRDLASTTNKGTYRSRNRRF